MLDSDLVPFSSASLLDVTSDEEGRKMGLNQPCRCVFPLAHNPRVLIEDRVEVTGTCHEHYLHDLWGETMNAQLFNLVFSLFL